MLRRALTALPTSAAVALAMAALAVVTALPAGASTTLQETAAAINSGAKVVVSPDAPGYNSQTKSHVNAAQTSPTVLVELSATATFDTGGDGQRFANALDAATHDRYIIAVAFVADTSPHPTVTYYTATHRLSPDVNPDDVMQQAESSGRGTESTLSIFGYYMDQALQNNPAALLPIPKPSAPSGGPGSTGSASSGSAAGGLLKFVFVGGLLILALCILGLVLLRRRSGGRVRLRATPDDVRDLMRQILDLRDNIKDQNLCTTITQMASDLDALFRKLATSSPAQLNSATVTYTGYLDSALKILKRYIDIQNNHRYYDDPVGWMRDGRQAISGLAEAILSNARRAGERELTSYRVDTKILDAQRYA